MTESIQLTTPSAGITVLTFNRPHVLNALNFEMMTAFAQTIDQLEAADNLRVLVLTGAGDRAFCSGGDLRELARHPTEDDARDFITLVGDTLHRMEQLPIPVIAAINGYALGGGCEIALACDMRFISADTRMGMVQINQGLIPGWGGGQRLLRLVGYSTAIEFLLRGETMLPPHLHTHGLVNAVVDDEPVLDYVLSFAEAIASRPAPVIRSIKQLLRAGLSQSYEDALHTERDLFPPLWADDAHLQAVAAFIAQRDDKPQKS